MTVDELFIIFLNHQHFGTYPDAKALKILNKTTIISDDKNNFIILISPNGTKYRLGVEDDGTLKTTKM